MRLAIYLMCTTLSLMCTVGAADAPFLRFKWIKKLLMKNKKFKENEEKYEQLKNNLENALKTEDFKHQYLAHFQLHINHYQEVINQWSEKKELHFNAIESLQNNLDDLAKKQSHLIQTFAKKSSLKENIKQIQKIERDMTLINNYVKEKQENCGVDEEFLKRYQQYLEKTDLTHLMQSHSKKEKDDTFVNEEAMKKQIHQKL